MFDLVIRGGTLADGTGAPLVEADVAVADGRVAAVGRVLGRGVEEIDARGLLVTPGFVDVHTHYDGQAVWDSRLQPSSWHGVTTAVMGNCGVGFAPVLPEHRALLVALMEGVEDIPGTALHEGLNWSWSSFAEYLDAVDARPHDMDICAQLPHGALRVHVMGARGARLEPAREDDIARMRALAAEAIRAGAIGFSTSRTLNHRSVTGDPTPSLRASAAELTGIALGLADAGAGVLQVISDFTDPDPRTEFAMIREMARRSGRPVSISLAQSHRAPEGWRGLMAMIDAATAEGIAMRAQVAPRPIGLLFGLEASLHPFMLHPAFKALEGAGLGAILAALDDPDFRARLLAETPATAKGNVFLARITDWARMFPLGERPDYEPPRGASVAALAAVQGRDPAAVALDLLRAEEGRALLFQPFANYARYDLDCCHDMLAAPNAIPGLGDGGAHVGIISDGSFPTYLLSHWGRDRPSGRFDLSFLVKRQTLDTARAMGLGDRGVVAPGYKADLNVIDFDQLAVERPRLSFDLPAGGKRLLQRARGYRATIVSGAVTYRDGAPTGALPGRLVRGPQAAMRP